MIINQNSESNEKKIKSEFKKNIHFEKLSCVEPFQSEQIDLERFHCNHIVLEPIHTESIITIDTSKNY